MSAPPRPGPRKRLVFKAIILLCLIAAVELASAVALRTMKGHWLTRRAFLAETGAAQAAGPAASGERVEADADGGPREEPVVAGLHAPDWMLHPFIGYVRHPESKPARLWGQKIRVGLNEHGFFGPSPVTRRSEDTFVVYLTGGSVALQLYLLAGEMLIAELEKLPLVGGRKVELVCTAMGGMKQPQQVLALNYFLALGAEYDMVINIDGFNEVVLPIAENLEAGIFPFYPRNWITYGAISIDPAEALLYGRLAHLKAEREERIATLGEGPWRFSYLALALWEIRQRRLDAEIVEVEKQLRQEKAAGGLSPQQRGPPYERDGWELITEQILDMWINGSVQMWRLGESLGFTYFHFLQPNQYVADSKPLTAYEKRFTVSPYSEYGKNAMAGYPVLIEAGQRLVAMDAPYFDLTGIFERVTETVYRDNCCHLNHRGNRLLAAAVAQRIAGVHQTATGARRAGFGDGDRGRS